MLESIEKNNADLRAKIMYAWGNNKLLFTRTGVCVDSTQNGYIKMRWGLMYAYVNYDIKRRVLKYPRFFEKITPAMQRNIFVFLRTICEREHVDADISTRVENGALRVYGFPFAIE